jgi:hypothetical protein
MSKIISIDWDKERGRGSINFEDGTARYISDEVLLSMSSSSEQIDILTTSYRKIRKDNFDLRRQLDGCCKNRDYWYAVARGHIEEEL